VRTVVRKNNHSFVIEIDKAEMMRRLDSGAVPLQEVAVSGGVA